MSHYAPGGDHREVRRERCIGELEAHLIVAFARATVRERIGADGAGDLDLPARDQGARHGGAQEVLPAIHRACAQRRPDKIFDELPLEVLDVAGVGS